MGCSSNDDEQHSNKVIEFPLFKSTLASSPSLVWILSFSLFGSHSLSFFLSFQSHKNNCDRIILQGSDRLLMLSYADVSPSDEVSWKHLQIPIDYLNDN